MYYLYRKTIINFSRAPARPEQISFENCIILSPTNREAAARNLHYLSLLEQPEFTYEAVKDEGFSQKNTSAKVINFF